MMVYFIAAAVIFLYKTYFLRAVFRYIAKKQPSRKTAVNETRATMYRWSFAIP